MLCFPRLWPGDLPQGMNEKGELRGVINVAFSPDNKWLATIGNNSPEIRLWQKGEDSIIDKDHPRILLPNEKKVWSFAFSPDADGSYLATVGFDKHVHVWDKANNWVEIPASIDHPMEHEDTIFTADFYQNKERTITRLATGSKDGTIKVWNLPDCQKIAQERVKDSEIWRVAFHPNGQLLATAHTNGEAHLWRVEGNNLISLAALEHKHYVGAAAFSPDGQWFATASSDNRARVWELEGSNIGKLRAEMWHNGPVGHVSFSPDSKWLVTGSEDGTARIWETTNWSELARLVHESGSVEKKSVSIAIAPNHKLVATGAWDGTARVWDPLTGKELKRMEHEKEVSWVAFSPDSKLLLTGCWDGKSRIWNVDDCVSASEPPEKGLKVVILCENGTKIAAGGSEQQVKVWDTKNGNSIAMPMANEPRQEVQNVEKSGDICRKPNVISLAFDKEGSRVASGSEDGKARVWDVKSKELVGSVLGHKAFVRSVALSPDGKLLATGSGDTVVRLWKLEDGENRWQLRRSVTTRGRGKLFSV